MLREEMEKWSTHIRMIIITPGVCRADERAMVAVNHIHRRRPSSLDLPAEDEAPRAFASTETAFLYIDTDLHTSVASALAQAVLSWETQVGLWKLMEGRRDGGTDGGQQQMGLGIPLAACQQPGQLPRSVLQRPGPIPEEPLPTSGSSLSSGARAGPLQQLIHNQADSGYCIG
ncbi:hypothetical protein AOLI_G00203850 [Acnodon oligacanthus]